MNNQRGSERHGKTFIKFKTMIFFIKLKKDSRNVFLCLHSPSSPLKTFEIQIQTQNPPGQVSAPNGLQSVLQLYSFL